MQDFLSQKNNINWRRRQFSELKKTFIREVVDIFGAGENFLSWKNGIKNLISEKSPHRNALHSEVAPIFSFFNVVLLDQ